MAQISLTVEHCFAALESGREQWDQFCLSTGASIYQSFDWCREWWGCYGERKKLYVFFVKKDGELIGLLPMYVETVRFGPLRLRLGRLVGANNPPRLFDPPLQPATAAEACEAVFNHLLIQAGCDVISFGPLSQTYRALPALQQFSLASGRGLAEVVEVPFDRHTDFFLPATLEAYMGTIARNESKNYNVTLRRLKRAHQTDIDVLSDAQSVEAEFGRFREMHTAQWQAEGRPGHFNAWPKAEAFHQALVRSQAQAGRLRLLRVKADQEVIAYQYIFSFGDCYYWQLPARKVDPALEHFSVGRIGMITMVDAAIKEGITRIEGGLGHYEYKLRLGAREQQARTFRLYSRRPASRIRAVLFSGAVWLMLNLYHKLWYRRIQPRLPRFFQRPLWDLWVRMNF
jgi:CelD/BcsL family acetyltransferase involved in cellulose biosynthesis